jgi:hypothetical protein
MVLVDHVFHAAELTKNKLQVCGLEPASELPADGESSDGVHSRKFGWKPHGDGLEEAQHGRPRWWRLLLGIPPAMLWIVQQPRAHVPARSYVVSVITHTARGKPIMLERVVRIAR